MPRHPRLFLPNVPLHIIQRGHDRQPVFVQPADYDYYLSNLAEMKVALNVHLYAYCLMTNHVHLIVSPGDEVSNISALMRTIAARQTRYVNKIENRTGTLWEGRFKASLIESDAYLLACCRYVDLNPVRASMVARPDDYRWSSYRGHAALEHNDWLDEHAIYRELGGNRTERGHAYQEFVVYGTSDTDLALFRTAVQRNQLTGRERFRDAIAERTGRRISSQGRGRPSINKPDTF